MKMRCECASVDDQESKCVGTQKEFFNRNISRTLQGVMAERQACVAGSI